MKIETHFILCLMVEFGRTQFSLYRRHSKTPCEIHGTALVEQFFNVIFAEFQHSPPECTCVQMCEDQPTYCYPNGCFKKERKKSSPVSSIQQDKKTIFLVDNDGGPSDLVGNINVMTAAAGTAAKSYQSQWEPFIARTTPPKEILFKYKRQPKLEMKYNLREQIKHARDRRAEIDLSKTRWPTNKQINRQTNHQRTSNYLTFPEANHETPKYFTRYLTKRENQIGLDISALYLYKDASNFSLEGLIDNLIERGLEGANRTSTFEISNSNKNNEVNISKLSSAEDFQNDTNIDLKRPLTADGHNARPQKEIPNITNTSTAAYFELITTLSNEIEKQNNISLEVIGNLSGNTFYDISTNPVNVSHKKTSLRFENVIQVAEEAESTTNKPTTLRFTPVINSQVKKSKQRIVRKLRNRKFN